jgi:cytochrome c-type biogenesis protein CcmH
MTAASAPVAPAGGPAVPRRAGLRGGLPRLPRLLAAATSLALLLLVVLAAAAHAATPRTTLEDVERELMCVTCKTPLEQSDAVQANRERNEIERLIAQGKTKAQVIDGMVDVYGDDVLLDPPQSGLRTVRWVLPAAGAIVAVLLLSVLIRRWRRRAAQDPEDPPAPDAEPDLEASSSELTDDDQRRLDADLRRYA